MKSPNDNGQQNLHEDMEPTPQIGDEVSVRCHVEMDVDCLCEVVNVNEDGSLELVIIQGDLPQLVDESCIASWGGDLWYADYVDIDF